MTLMEMFIALVLLVSADTSFIYVEPEPGQEGFKKVLYGQERIAAGIASCGDPNTDATKYCGIWYTEHLTIEGWVHELAHAYDGLHDGTLNGSPGHPRPRTLAAARRYLPEHTARGEIGYCYSNDVEWYACAVLEKLRLR